MRADGPADELLPPDAGAAARPDRRQRRIAFWCGVMVVVAAGGMLWRRCSERTWGPLPAMPSDLLAGVLEREEALPPGAALQNGGPGTLRVFGIPDRSTQDRLTESAERETLRRGGVRGGGPIRLEFWSGPPWSNDSGDRPPPGATLLRTVEIR